MQGTQEINADQIASMSDEELQALEDKMETESAQAEDGEEGASASDQPTQEAAPDKGDQAGDGGAKDTSTDPSQAAADDGKKDDSSAQNEEDLSKHVSPPSKWAQQRHEQKRLKNELNEFREKAARADELEEKLGTVEQEMEWIKTAIKDKGIDLPSTPLEQFSDAKIEEVREEFGNELADMFKATAAMLAKGQAPTASQSTKAEPAPKDQEKPKDKAGAQEDTGDEVDPALLEAIDDNDELSYWRENSPGLWKKAIDMDASLLNDPAYLQKTYADRFTTVVEQVKKAVTSGVQPPGGDDGASPPGSLSGSPGVAPTQQSNSALDRVMAAGSEDQQLSVYNGLTETERDEVDKALGI